jgi:hypothetical protein
MPKQPNLDKLYPIVEKLSTADQIKLKEFIQKTLDSKKAEAKAEFNLIENGKQ